MEVPRGGSVTNRAVLSSLTQNKWACNVGWNYCNYYFVNFSIINFNVKEQEQEQEG